MRATLRLVRGRRPSNISGLSRRLWLGTLTVMMLGAVGRTAQGAVILVTTLQQKVDSTIPGCSLQEAIYAANLQASLAIDKVNADGTDHFITTSCVPGTGNDTILLPVGGPSFPETLFEMSKVVIDAHNYLGATATPLVFSTVTIEANGAVLEWIGSRSARAFAVGQGTVMLSVTQSSSTAPART